MKSVPATGIALLLIHGVKWSQNAVVRRKTSLKLSLVISIWRKCRRSARECCHCYEGLMCIQKFERALPSCLAIWHPKSVAVQEIHRQAMLVFPRTLYSRPSDSVPTDPRKYQSLEPPSLHVPPRLANDIHLTDTLTHQGVVAKWLLRLTRIVWTSPTCYQFPSGA